MFILTAPILTITSILVLGIFYALQISAQKIVIIRKLCLSVSFAALFVGVLTGLSFDKSAVGFQYLSAFNYVEEYNSSFALGVDGLSYIFLMLTLVTFPFLFLAAWTVSKFPKQFFCHLLAMEILLVLTFVTIDLFYFFILFESLLIPMFILIGVWGARTRKIKAAYYFFLYTLFGSLFMLFGMIYLYQLAGSLNYHVLLSEQLDLSTQKLLWSCFFLAFAVKMPLFPFHIWLPEAHVEAPTVGSMLLASLLLKLGGYGLLRFSLTFLADASAVFTPLVSALAVAGVIYGSLSTIRQVDLKRIIAYSSVAHMNLVALGLFSFTRAGIEGAIYLMVAHGVVSAALFFCVGVIYDRTHTRLLRYYGGLVTIMPVFAAFFFIFNLANMGFPGTPNFVGELLMLTGIFNLSPSVLFFSSWGIVLSAAYSTILFAKTMFGTLKTNYIVQFIDVTRREAFILSAFAFLSLILGLRSDLLLAYVEGAVWNITSYSTPVAHSTTARDIASAPTSAAIKYTVDVMLLRKNMFDVPRDLLIFLAIYPSYCLEYLLAYYRSNIHLAMPLLVLLIPLLSFSISLLNFWPRILWRVLFILVQYMFILFNLIYIYLTMLEDIHITTNLGTWICSDLFEVRLTLEVSWWPYTLLAIIFLLSTLELLVLWGDFRTGAATPLLLGYFTLRTFFLVLAATSGDFVVLFAASSGVSVLSYLVLRFWSVDGPPARHAFVCLLINQIADFFLLLAGCIVYSVFSTTEFAVIKSLILEITPPPITLFGYTVYPLAHVSNLLFCWISGKVVAFGIYAKHPRFVGGASPAVTFIHVLVVGVFATLLFVHFYPLLTISQMSVYVPVLNLVFTLLFLHFSASESAPPFYLNASYPRT